MSTRENPAAAAAASAVLLLVVLCAPVKSDAASARVTPSARLTGDEKLTVFDEGFTKTIRSLFSSLCRNEDQRRTSRVVLRGVRLRRFVFRFFFSPGGGTCPLTPEKASTDKPPNFE